MKSDIHSERPADYLCSHACERYRRVQIRQVTVASSLISVPQAVQALVSRPCETSLAATTNVQTVSSIQGDRRSKVAEHHHGSTE